MTDKPNNHLRSDQPTRGMGESIGESVGRAVGRFFDSSGRILPSIRNHATPSGAPVDPLHTLDALQFQPRQQTITCTDYSPQQIHRQQLTDPEQLLTLEPTPEHTIRWIHIYGQDVRSVGAAAQAFDIHPLTIEDILEVPHRTKLDYIDESAFVIARLFDIQQAHVIDQQVSILWRPGLVVSFMEEGRISQPFDPIHRRLDNTASQLRKRGADFLAYALLDLLVDICFPLVEQFRKRIHQLEKRILTDSRPDPAIMDDILRMNRQLLIMRTRLSPMRQVVAGLARHKHPAINKGTRAYMDDVGDHVIEVVDMLEVYARVGSELLDRYNTAVDVKMNEVMKVLTVIAAPFLPLTFLTGFYGMNIPLFGQAQEWSQGSKLPFLTFCTISFCVVVGMLWYFRRKHWI